MVADTLPSPSLPPVCSWGSGKFSQLLLEHDEYYFRRERCLALVHPLLGSSDESSESSSEASCSSRRACRGILHICSNGLLLELSEQEMPVVRIAFSEITKFAPWMRTEQEIELLHELGADPDVLTFKRRQQRRLPSDARDNGRSILHKVESSLLKSLHRVQSYYAHPQPDAKGGRAGGRERAGGCWEHVQVEARVVSTALEGSSCHSYRKLAPAGPMCFSLWSDEDAQDSKESSAVETISLLMALAAMEKSAESIAMRQDMIKQHEMRRLEVMPSCPGETLCHGRCVKIEPLVLTPGRFTLTDKAIYFRAFCQNDAEEEERVFLSEVFRVARRRHHLSHTAIEITFKGGRGRMLVMFGTSRDCSIVWKHLVSVRPILDDASELEGITRAWQEGAISNYHYLMHLNSMADRSFNDIAQYPVFPWVIRDYDSQELNLESEETFRDLSRPIGALNEERLARLIERYHTMEDPKYLYGTHYSTPAYVVYYLLRSAPQHALRVHGGKFDHADRAFASIKGTWEMCLTNSADVKELIPEFFQSQGDFLVNNLNLDLGVRHDGKRLHHVQLPPWASGPKDFTRKNRQALESKYVSEHLHQWIDLIFGFKQRGESAKMSFNVFHPMSYEGAINLDDIRVESERIACLEQISEFGQIPKQLFTSPHPKRRGAMLRSIPWRSDSDQESENSKS